MSELFSKEEKILLMLLKEALAGEKQGAQMQGGVPSCEWEKLVRTAAGHAVLPLLYDVFAQADCLPSPLFLQVQKKSRVTVCSNYRLLFLTRELTQCLQAHGITPVILKGAATAALYPVPELRKSGDVDVLIPLEKDFTPACDALKSAGFSENAHQSSIHHMELKNAEGITVEVHGMLAEPFANEGMNCFLQKLQPEYAVHRQKNTDWGVTFYEPTAAYHAFYLVIHMLQHFLRAGFGLKNLCDWVVFWNRTISWEEKKQLTALLAQSGTSGFVRLMTAACVQYLGLEKENVEFLLTEEVKSTEAAQFMREVFDAGEFGRSAGDRMVAMRGTGLRYYVQEFHHQMRLNYPRAGKCVLLWPPLWVLTLVRFFINNRAVRGVTAREIFCTAKRRSALVERMRLFEE